MTEKDKRMELPKMSLDDLFTIQGERDAKETSVMIVFFFTFIRNRDIIHII